MLSQTWAHVQGGGGWVALTGSSVCSNSGNNISDKQSNPATTHVQVMWGVCVLSHGGSARRACLAPQGPPASQRRRAKGLAGSGGGRWAAPPPAPEVVTRLAVSSRIRDWKGEPQQQVTGRKSPPPRRGGAQRAWTSAGRTTSQQSVDANAQACVVAIMLPNRYKLQYHAPNYINICKWTSVVRHQCM
jgi:hypothetical protein